MNESFDIKLIESLEHIDAQSWNRLVPDNHPFMQHAFLYGLEKHRCAHKDTGWRSHFLIATDSNDELIAALPCYEKNHSYGEYIFDWAWANAYNHSGLDYYPKFSCAIPFTPATGPRLLLKPSLDQSDKADISDALIKQLMEDAERKQCSSIHLLFNQSQLSAQFEKNDFFIRESTQFHWLNQFSDSDDNLYTSFDDFLSTLTSRKRKNIKRERRRVHEANVVFKWFSADELTEEIMDNIFHFYQRTIYRYSAQQYLNKGFFKHLQTDMPSNTAVLLAYHNDRPIAGGLFFRDDTTLYGRYWGAEDDYHSLHFETCYYQAIDYCIEHKLTRFEAGAQGEHKLSRGLLPKTTYSLHRILDPRFDEAIKRFVKEESQQIDRYQTMLNQHSPFREV